MKLIHTADWHLGKNIEGHSRLEEQRLFLKDFINICEEEQADIIIIAGDIYDNYNPSAMAEQLFYDTLKQLSRNGDCMTVVIAGNWGKIFSQSNATSHISHYPRTNHRVHAIKIWQFKFLLINIQ